MFNVGDIVRVREWDDMAREYGVDIDGDINTPVYFVKGMKPLCGDRAKITRIYAGGCIELYFLDSCSGKETDFCYHESMLEPYYQSSIVSFDEAEFMDMIGGTTSV